MQPPLALPAINSKRGPTLELLILALPMIGMTLSRMLMGFIDFVMVSWMGTAAQAAISPATMLLFAISCVGMGLVQGVQTFVSQADGRGEPQRSGAYVWQTFYIAAFFALLTLPVAVYSPVWFDAFGRWAGHPADVQAMEIDYIRIALWVVAPATLCVGLESFYNGIHRPTVGLIAMLASLVVNALGNYALILGRWGFPEMGIAGAALATVIGWWVRVAILMVPLLFFRSIDARYHTLRSFGPNLEKLRDIVKIGLPVSFQWLVDIGAWVVFMHVMLPRFGESAMAGANIAFQCMHLAFMPALGIGMALTTQVGNAVGARDAGLAEMRVRVARRLILGYMGAMGGLFILAGEPIARIFTADELVVLAAIPMLIWTAVFQVSDGMCVTYSFALRGAGDTRVPALLFAACCWGIFVVGGLALSHYAPGLWIHAPWSMCALYIIVLGVLLLRRFHSRAWERIKLFHDRPGTVDAAGGGEIQAATAPTTAG
ncbi:MAG: MATE family efflux transporter [Phycisphaerales bacterium]|nr:MATE family efflux transporter [Phycisphaerales bacterium]